MTETPELSSQKAKGGLPAFPFNLDNLFTLQFDQLKAAIEYIARMQGEQQVLIQEILTSKPGSITRDHKLADGADDEIGEV